MIKIIGLMFICVLASADSSIQISNKFESLVSPQEAGTMGLKTKEQKKAFESWALRFAVQIATQQSEASNEECVSVVRSALGGK